MIRRWRQFAIVLAAAAGGMVVLAIVLPFLAPSLSYQVKDSISESLSGNRGRKHRIALGVAAGSYFHLGTVLNRYLKEKAGYDLELVATAGVPENVGALLDPARRIHLATIESASEQGAKADGVYGLAAVGRQYFFVIVPADSAVREIRDLAGPVNPGIRLPGHAPTLGEMVLEYYGLPVSIVRPAGQATIRDSFEAGHHVAVTRTQFLHAGLIDEVLQDEKYRLVPIRDHEALASSLPGTQAGFIPAGIYGPQKRIPPEPVATLSVSTLLVARGDLPARVVNDVLDVVYDPRFARDIRYATTLAEGRRVGDLPLHPAAAIYYRRNDEPTSERIGRISFVATVIGACVAAVQFVVRFRQNERRKVRRKLLMSEIDKLDAIRRRVERSPDALEARALIAEADELLCGAERDAAADLLDADGIASLRSLHRICSRALQQRLERALAVEHPPVHAASGEAVPDAR